jgi:hypothetical protein
VHMRTADRTRRTQIPADGNDGFGMTPGIHEEVGEGGINGYEEVEDIPGEGNTPV